MGKEKGNLEMVASEAAPRRRTKNTAGNRKKAKADDSLQLAPATDASTPSPTYPRRQGGSTVNITNTKQNAKAAALRLAPATDGTATPSTAHGRRGLTHTVARNKKKAKENTLQLAPATYTSDPSATQHRRRFVDTLRNVNLWNHKKQDEGIQLASGTHLVGDPKEALQLATNESIPYRDRTTATRSEAYEAHVPGQREVEKQSRRRARSLSPYRDRTTATRSEAYEAYVPGQRKVEKQSRRRARDGSPTLLEGDNVKVEADILSRRRCRLYLFWALFFIPIALVIGVSVGVTQSITSTANLEERTDSPSRVPSTIPSISPTESPSSTPTSANFETVVKHLSREDFGPSTVAALQDPNSPQSRAARWIVDEDEMFTFPLNETDPKSQLRRRFRQRYALATFYFSTGGDTSWKSRGAFLSPTEDECGWGDAGFGNLQVNCRTECRLFATIGLNESCDEMLPVVAGLTMYQLNLVGRIPPEIGALTLLAGLDLTGNELTGSLPNEIYNLRYLNVMSVAFNQITGSLSDTGMKALSNLASLSVTHNQMTGTLPSEISMMMDLLDLSNNFFSGTAPREWPQRLTRLMALSLADNMLVGEIPRQMGQLTQLVYLALSDNAFNGTLSTALPSISTLLDLTLAFNQLSGTFPPEYASSTSLERIDVEFNLLTGTLPTAAWLESRNLKSLLTVGNKFTGTIPSELGSLGGLENLGVGGSGLTNTIPTEVGLLGPTLEQLVVSGSPGLQGTIPTELGMLRNLSHFLLAANDLSGTIPDEIATPKLVVFAVYGNRRLTGSLPDSFDDIFPEIIWVEGTSITGNTSVICDRYQPVEFNTDCEEVYCSCCTLCYVNGTYRQPFEVYG